MTCELLDSSGGGPLHDGWLWVENPGRLAVGREQWALPVAPSQRWTRRWFVLWPTAAHPQHGSFLFYFLDRNAAEAEGCIQITAPVIRRPKTPREGYYSLRLNADFVRSADAAVASSAGGLSVANRKLILGTRDTEEESGEARMREWIAALRSAGPRWQQESAAAPPDCCGWLLQPWATLSFYTAIDCH